MSEKLKNSKGLFNPSTYGITEQQYVQDGHTGTTIKHAHKLYSEWEYALSDSSELGRKHTFDLKNYNAISNLYLELPLATDGAASATGDLAGFAAIKKVSLRVSGKDVDYDIDGHAMAQHIMEHNTNEAWNAIYAQAGGDGAVFTSAKTVRVPLVLPWGSSGVVGHDEVPFPVTALKGEVDLVVEFHPGSFIYSAGVRTSFDSTPTLHFKNYQSDKDIMNVLPKSLYGFNIAHQYLDNSDLNGSATALTSSEKTINEFGLFSGDYEAFKVLISFIADGSVASKNYFIGSKANILRLTNRNNDHIYEHESHEDAALRYVMEKNRQFGKNQVNSTDSYIYPINLSESPDSLYDYSQHGINLMNQKPKFSIAMVTPNDSYHVSMMYYHKSVWRINSNGFLEVNR